MPGAGLTQVVDLPDGRLRLLPNPAVVRTFRLIAATGALIFLVSGTVMVYLGTTSPGPWLVVGLVLVVAGIVDGPLLWFLLQPPVLTAGPVEVSCLSPTRRQRMARSEVARVFRGQTPGVGRAAGTWTPAYLFLGPDGRVGISATTFQFSEMAMSEFLERLGVPVAGDFSRKVAGGYLEPT